MAKTKYCPVCPVSTLLHRKLIASIEDSITQNETAFDISLFLYQELKRSVKSKQAKVSNNKVRLCNFSWLLLNFLQL